MQHFDDIESDRGKARLDRLLQKIKRLNGDNEDGQSNVMRTDMPWENIGSADVAREIKKCVFALGYD